MIIVLKLGGSVLRGDDALPAAVHEVYRFLREGRRVIAVVSALGGRTDALLDRARRLGARDDAATASLLASGEAESAALLALALDRAGVPARVLDVHGLGLRADGPPLAAEPRGLDVTALRAALESAPVVVVPGFVARGSDGRTVLLGRGGSDLTAVLLAAALGARVRLVKDVAGVFESDPAGPGKRPRRFRTLSWDEALGLGAKIVQPAALRAARDASLPIEVAACHAQHATIIGSRAASFFGEEDEAAGPLRVGLLGLGTVGLGVLRAIERVPSRLVAVRALVRRPRPYLDLGLAPSLLTTRAEDFASGCDVVVDALSGAEPAASIVRAALRRGVDVVSANKAALLALGDVAHGARLLDSAAVGGGVPVLETLRARPGVRRIDAVLNGTSTFVLDRLAEGASLDDAVHAARIAGLAEEDPTEDLDGTDAARKAVLLARRAFGLRLELGDVARTGILGLDLTDGRRWRLVATIDRDGARVEPRALREDDPLGSARDEGNAFVLTHGDGEPIVLHGKGAGRHPTTESVIGDLLELARVPALSGARP